MIQIQKPSLGKRVALGVGAGLAVGLTAFCGYIVGKDKGYAEAQGDLERLNEEKSAYIGALKDIIQVQGDLHSVKIEYLEVNAEYNEIKKQLEELRGEQ